MNPLAIGGGDVIFVVVMLVFGLIKWLSSKATTPTPQPQPRTNTPRRATPPPAASESEEEARMRRFMEALGIPADQAPPAPAPVPRRVEPPREMPQPRPVLRRPVPAPPPIPVEREMPSLDEAPAPTMSVEEIHLPELQTPELADFATVTSSISASRSDYLPAEQAASETPTVTHSTPPSSTILATLRNPAAIRDALVLREILGPPRALQS